MAFWDKWRRSPPESVSTGSAQGLSFGDDVKGASLDAIVAISRELSGFGGFSDDRQFSHALGDYQSTIAAAYACVNERAKSLSHVPLRLWKRDPQGVKREITSGNAFSLINKVNPYWTGQKLIDATERSLCYYGKAFWLVERFGKNTPPNLWWLHPGKMRVIPGEGYIEGYKFVDRGTEIAFRPDEIVWIPYFWTEGEFDGLSPLSAARMSADTSIDALGANRKFFKNGMHIGGLISPKEEGQRFTKEQITDLENSLHRRLAGSDKAHRWLVLNGAVDARNLGVNPRDAEFLQLMGWGKTDLCSVYSVPPAIIGHYVANGINDPDAALRLFWDLCLIPEARFLASEITEKLLPLYPGEADYAEFDLSGVKVLQEDQIEVAQIMAALFNMRVPLNPLLRKYFPDLIPEGSNGFPWGDDPLELPGITGLATPGQSERGVKTISVPSAPVNPAWRNTSEGQQYLSTVKHGAEPKDDGSTAALLRKAQWLLKQGAERNGTKAEESPIPTYASDAHKAHMAAYEKALSPWEKKFKALVTGLFEAQRDAVLRNLKGFASYRVERSGNLAIRSTVVWARADGYEVRGGHRYGDIKAIEPDDPFDRDEAEKEFAEAALPIMRDISAAGGNAALRRVGVGISFDVSNPRAQRALRTQAQRFAREVNETTYQRLKDSLADGIAAGEGIPELEARVSTVMDGRIDSSAETIARTEVGKGYSTGEIFGYHQSGIVKQKGWLSTLDGQTRDSHIDMHGQIVDLDDDFKSPDGGSAPGPLQFNIPEEDINCRCSTTAIVDSNGERHFVPLLANGNGAY